MTWELRKLLRHIKPKEKKVLLVRDLGHNRTHGMQWSNLFDHISSHSLYNHSCLHFRSLLSVVSYWGFCKPFCFHSMFSSSSNYYLWSMHQAYLTHSYILPSCQLFFEKLFSYYSLKNISLYMFSFSCSMWISRPLVGGGVGNSMLFYKWKKSSVRWRVKVNCDFGKSSLLWMSCPIFLTAWASV